MVERDAVGNPIPGQLDVAPKLYSVLSTSASDPNVALVYVSASRQAGGRPAEVTFTQDDPVAPTDFHPVNVIITSDIEESASYRVVFGDSVVVTEQVDASSGEVSSATVDVFRTVITSLDGGASLTRIAFDSVSYSTTNPAGVQVAGGVTSETSGTDPIVRTTIYADELTLVALDASDNPLFTSSVLDGSGTTPGLFFGRPDFPRWFLSVDNTQAGMLDSVAWREAVGPDSVETLRALGSPTLTWLDELSTPTGEGFGEYLFEWDDSEYGPGRTFTIDVANPEVTEALFQASLEQRQVATETSTSAEVAAALGVTTDDLAQVKLPFRVLHSAPNRDVTVAMLATSKLESIALGRDVDQVQVDVPADQWVPGEALVFVETVSTFQRAVGAAGEYVVTQAGQPVVVDTQLVTWSSATLGCPGRPTCNAVTAGTRGADAAAHLALNPGVQMLRVRYFNAYSPQTSYVFEISKTISGADATEIEPEDLENIRVVPNPYVVFSVYEQRIGERRLMFTGLPPRGTIEIYTVSGQFVQRISYTESDLAGNGDLYWNMRTRENTDIASGLYIFVVRGILPATGEQVKKLGKFVVIR